MAAPAQPGADAARALAGADADVRAAAEYGASTLDLSFRGLRTLPRGLGRLAELRALDLGSNLLTTLGFEGSSGDGADTEEMLPAGLQTLRLGGNLLEDVPQAALASLLQLQLLDVSRNRLGTLPALIANCTSLLELDLARNQLTVLPASLGLNLTLLRHLDVGYNSLRTLPDSLGQLQHLEFLSARFNQLERVPSSLARATALQHLDLSGNFVNLTAVPGALGNLRNLTHLDLSNNQIGALPVQLGRLSALRTLLLDGNPLHFPPLDLLTLSLPRPDEPVQADSETTAAQRQQQQEAQTEAVKAFLAAKLQEWEEQGRPRGGGGGAQTWQEWLAQWPLLQEWLAPVLASVWGISSPPVYALEGASASVAPRAQALPGSGSTAVQIADPVAAPLVPQRVPERTRESRDEGMDADHDELVASMPSVEHLPPITLAVSRPAEKDREQMYAA